MADIANKPPSSCCVFYPVNLIGKIRFFYSTAIHFIADKNSNGQGLGLVIAALERLSNKTFIFSTRKDATMKRSTLLSFSVLFLFTLAASVASAQGRKRSTSLVDRIGQLRKNIFNSENDEPKNKRVASLPQPTASANGSSGRVGSSLTPIREANERAGTRAFPQVNPRDLLPKNIHTLRAKRHVKTKTKAAPRVALRSKTRSNGPPITDSYGNDDSVIGNELETINQYGTSNPTTSSTRSNQNIDGVNLDPLGLNKSNRYSGFHNPTGRQWSTEQGPSEQGMQESDRLRAALPINNPRQSPSAVPSAQREIRNEADAARLRQELLGLVPSHSAPDATHFETPAAAPIVEAPVAMPTQPIIETRNDIAPRATTINNTSSQDAKEAFAEKTPIEIPTSSDAARDAFTESADEAGSLPPATEIALEKPFNEPPRRNVLAFDKAPVLSSSVTGPKQIMIGQEAEFIVNLRNTGEVTADGVVATINVPAWAEVNDASASNGFLQRPENSDKPGQMQWQLQRLESGKTEQLTLRIVPRSSRPMHLNVTWKHAPVGARAVIEVQEPKLRMVITGPDEVLFGQPQTYRLALSNPGTGLAEDVVVNLMPPGGGDASVSSHSIGSIAPGRTQAVEVELTAREAGKLFVRATAVAKGNLEAAAEKELFCRKPELEIDWRGPGKKFSGTLATYYFRVRNPGTAKAEGVTMSVRLPEGIDFVGASEGQQFNAKTNTVSWPVGTLRPGDDYYMELRAKTSNAGMNNLLVSAITSDGQLQSQKTATTEVVALADLKLEILDPKGPVPIEEEAIYEIRIRNRGSNVAESIRVVALFSQGIEPQDAEGSQYSVHDGRVTFQPIDRLAAGREIVLKIRARALTAGTHVFRAEVLCSDLDIKLAAEETTRFYQDNSATDGPVSGPRSARNQSRFESFGK